MQRKAYSLLWGGGKGINRDLKILGSKKGRQERGS